MLSYQEQHSFSFESRSCIQLCSQFPNNLSNMHHTRYFRLLKGHIPVASLNRLILLVVWACLLLQFLILHTCHNEATKKSAYVINRPFFFLACETTQLFPQKKVKNSIITTNSVIASQKVSTDKKQKQMNCQLNTQNNRFNWALSLSTQLPLLRTQPRKAFRSYPQRWLLYVSQSHTQLTTPKGPQN